MKKNTQKLLLSLYSSNRNIRNSFSITVLDWIWPELTMAGKRSLLNLLRKQSLVLVERIIDHNRLTLTEKGSRQLEAYFPALSRQWDLWDGTWMKIVFLQPPSNDKQFRYLRQFLVNKGCQFISRGVYLCATPTYELINNTLENIYLQNVVVVKIREWIIGSEQQLVVRTPAVFDLITAYSGISKEIQILLPKNEEILRLNNRQKSDLSLVIDRLVDTIMHDPGFCGYYYKEMPKVKDMINDISTLVKTI